MPIDFLLDVLRQREAEEAVVFRDRSHAFGWLLQAVAEAGTRMGKAGVGPGAAVALEADWSPASIAYLLALMEARAIAVPLAPTAEANKPALRDLAAAEWRIVAEDDVEVRIESTGRAARHSLYDRLRGDRHPGLVLFTSGSTGEPKGAVHDCVRLLRKYRTPRHRHRTLLFLLFDHIGGIDTLLQALANGSTVVIPDGRSPEAVCRAVAQHRVEVLPAAPSFLTMLLLSEVYRAHDLSSLRYITYGAEVMPQGTLTALARVFPSVTLLQKYGITEVGTLRSRSRANDSLWVKIGGEGYQTRVVDGMLEIKAESSMLGYLNAPLPFTADGWFITGDAVEVDGEYFKILGRASDLINVGGQKVYPAEVEAVIQQVENVAEAAVSGEPHPFTGKIVVARVTLLRPEDHRIVEQRVREYCRARLEAYKVPAKVMVASQALHSERLKTTRR